MADPGSPRPFPLVLAAGLAALTLVLGAGLYVFRSLRSLPGETLDKGAQTLREARALVEAFRTQKVTTTFAGDATDLAGTSRLQVATLRSNEVFAQQDQATVFWGSLQLPDVVVEARAPVEYVYFLDLGGVWRFELREAEREIRVNAPALQFNTPAVDVGQLTYVVQQGSVLRDETLALERLKQGLPALAKERARRSLPLARDTARRQTEEFVERWLARRFGAEAEGYRARVVFADEPPRLSAPSAPAPAEVPAR